MSRRQDRLSPAEGVVDEIDDEADGEVDGGTIKFAANDEPSGQGAGNLDQRPPARRSERSSSRSAGHRARRRGVRDVVRAVVRNLIFYPLSGAGVLAVRGWEAQTNSRYERLMRAAEAAGDREWLAEWELRGERAREHRHQRLMGWLVAPLLVTQALLVSAVLGIGVLLALGMVLALANDDVGLMLAPLVAAVDGVAVLVRLASQWWRPTALSVAGIALVVLWRVGRAEGRIPQWVTPPAVRQEVGVILTPAGVAAALAHLGIPAMNRAVKDGWQVTFSTPPVRVNGRGYQAVFSLPLGVTPDMIVDKRDVLARNLHRAPLEVWPAAADQAGYVDLWVADQGTTEKPAYPYPLWHEGTADVFAGVPFGVSLRGDVITPALPGANVVFGGVMGQGKSNAARILMAGAALDPIAELSVFVFANNGDFDAYRPRLAHYHRGTEDPVVAAAVEGLRELYDEVGRREARLAALNAKKVTRTLAERNPDLRPRIVLFSECHELFGHPDYGREAADLATQTLRRGRKTAITLAFDTQSSRADAIPPKIVELVKINACFAVKTWRSNDGFLGDGSFQAGIRATELRMGKDVGTSVLTGATVERFEIVKWFYLDVDDDTGYDAATDLIARATSLYTPTIPATSAPNDQPAEQPRDLLADLDAVLGAERVPAADLPALLRGLAPDWPGYRGLTGIQLREWLARDYGIKVASTGRRYPVDPATIRDCLARQTATTQDDTHDADAQ